MAYPPIRIITEGHNLFAMLQVKHGVFKYARDLRRCCDEQHGDREVPLDNAARKCHSTMREGNAARIVGDDPGGVSR
jgi:hypothetical protein